MEKEFVPVEDYNRFLETTKYCDNPIYDINRIIDIYEFLKDKRVEKYTWDQKVEIVEDAHLDFLGVALGRTYFAPKYNEATEDFLKSDYLSSEVKKDIYDALKDKGCPDNIIQLLTSKKQISDFSKNEIKEIEKYLCKNEDNSEKCKVLYELYEDYIFVIDGDGPIEYIKEKNNYDLPNLLLDKSGIPSYPSYYSGYGVDRRYLNENHLFSIYKKFLKFYPDKADNFVELVRNINTLTPTEFVTNYLSFVRSGFNPDFDKKKGNVSVDGLYGESRDIVGAISMFHLFGREKSELEIRYESEENFSIRNDFLNMVKEYKEKSLTLKK